MYIVPKNKIKKKDEYEKYFLITENLTNTFQKIKSIFNSFLSTTENQTLQESDCIQISIDKTIKANQNSQSLSKQIKNELSIFKKLFDMFEQQMETNQPTNQQLNQVLKNVQIISKTGTIKDSISSIFNYKQIKFLILQIQINQEENYNFNSLLFEKQTSELVDKMNSKDRILELSSKKDINYNDILQEVIDARDATNILKKVIRIWPQKIQQFLKAFYEIYFDKNCSSANLFQFNYDQIDLLYLTLENIEYLDHNPMNGDILRNIIEILLLNDIQKTDIDFINFKLSCIIRIIDHYDFRDKRTKIKLNNKINTINVINQNSNVTITQFDNANVKSEIVNFTLKLLIKKMNHSNSKDSLEVNRFVKGFINQLKVKNFIAEQYTENLLKFFNTSIKIQSVRPLIDILNVIADPQIINAIFINDNIELNQKQIIQNLKLIYPSILDTRNYIISIIEKMQNHRKQLNKSKLVNKKLLNGQELDIKFENKQNISFESMDYLKLFQNLMLIINLIHKKLNSNRQQGELIYYNCVKN